MLELRLIHRCLPYCRPDEGQHTMVVYGSEDESPQSIRNMIERWDGARFVGAVEEPDINIEVDNNGRKLYAKAWLMTWSFDPAKEFQFYLVNDPDGYCRRP